MLAGVGPVAAVLFVVAATEGWMPQSEEHLAALRALGVQHVMVVISKADLADPTPVLAQTRDRLPDAPVVVGTDLDAVRAELTAMTKRLPPPDVSADVRLWVDRSFTVRGTGTVVTGTLAAGTVHVGGELEHRGRRVTVRGLQSLGSDASEVPAVARVAVNLRGIDRHDIGRGDALRTPGAWLDTDEIDVALRRADNVHRELVLHIGSAAVPVLVRPLGDAGARLRLSRALPLRVGDIGLLRDPGGHRIAAGVEVLDVRPPALRRRGAARARAAQIETGEVPPPECARADELRAMGFPATGQRIGDWVVDPQWWAQRRQLMMTAVRAWTAEHDIAAGMPMETLRQQVGLPSADLLAPLLDGTGLQMSDGVVTAPGAGLPPHVDKAVRTVEEWLAAEPFRAPEADELAGLALGPKELAAAVRVQRLTRIADGVVLGRDAVKQAAAVLQGLSQPFTVAEAKRALDTTRRVAVPLLELLDAQKVTRRNDDGTRSVITPSR
jgi:selenocysteine-specific elongation factor